MKFIIYSIASSSEKVTLFKPIVSIKFILYSSSLYKITFVVGWTYYWSCG